MSPKPTIANQPATRNRRIDERNAAEGRRAARALAGMGPISLSALYRRGMAVCEARRGREAPVYIESLAELWRLAG
jgi:hypothetical protein